MGLRVRLRLEIADVPGALARAAAIIAEHGGNITALDLQHSDENSAIDEVTIELGEVTDLTKLRRRLNDSGAVRVLALQSGSPEDLLVRILRRLSDATAKSVDDPDLQLRRGVAELCSTPAAWVSGVAEASAFAAGRQALASPGDAALAQTREQLPVLADTVTGESWLLAVAGRGSLGERRVVFVARPLAQAFTATEVGRIEALVSLYDQVEQLQAAARNLGPTR